MASCRDPDPQGDVERKETVLLKTTRPLIPRLSVFSPLQLQANVNLNLPPPNWLRASSPATAFSRVHFPHPVADSEPSSTALASHYPHAVGNVDVISDSQNIKKLLKLPYCPSPVSVAVHRVGETLLIDEFAAPMDLPAGFSASLDKVFERNMLELWFTARKKRPALTRHRNMFSKLLYYSLADRALLPAAGETGVAQTTITSTDEVPMATASGSEQTSDSDDSRSEDFDPDVAGDQFKTNLARIDTGSNVTVQLEKNTSADVNEVQVDVGGKRGVSPSKTTPTEDMVGPHLFANEGAGDTLNDKNSRLLLPAHVTMASVPSVQGDTGDVRPVREKEVKRGRQLGSEESQGRGRGDPTFPYSPPLPKPRPFHHDVQWDIADIRMLLGSDLPIFGSDSHPAISLRLRDMKKPITVLTGLDYWLDNLMCNVPELAMCFHLDGVVQRYETLKTEDIPNLKDSEFAPQEVLKVAQNILAFLKANCTREGHTYWLFRRRGEEVVKLYDITSLTETSTIEEEEVRRDQNPFAKSVAVLFYRVARNMLNSPHDPLLSGEDLGIAKLLLENCISLLRESDHIDNINISSSACYLLANLYLNGSSRCYAMSPDHRSDASAMSHDMRDDIHTRSCDRKLSITSDEDMEEEAGQEIDSVSTACLSSVDSKSLSVSALRQGLQTFPDDPTHPLPPLLLGCSRDRARLALESVSKGIAILDESLFGSSPPSPEVPLARTCGGHLLQMAGSAYLSLAVSCTKTNKYGRALRYTRCALLCFRSSKCVVNATTVQEPVDHFLSWQQCGDLHCLISKNSCSSDFEDFKLENPEDTAIIAAATRLHPPMAECKEEACLTIHSNRETSLWRSIDCYEKALQLVPSVPLLEAESEMTRTLRAHFGSAWNELGTYYMLMSSYLDYSQEKEKVEKLWMCSYSCLSRGLELYDEADSTTALNRAITFANMGCLTRACASVHTRLAEAESAEFSSEEKTYYEKSLQYYISAQQLVKRQSMDPEFWSSLMCDLALVHNAIAKHMLDRPPLSKLTPAEVERKVIDTLLKSLHCLEPQLSVVDRTTLRFRLVHQLAAESHYRLGSLYHKSAFSSSSSAQKQKHSRSQSEKHYNKAYQYYLPEYHARDILRLLLEKSTLFELQVSNGQGVKHQIKLLESALSSLLQCESTLQCYHPQTRSTEGSEGNGDSREEETTGSTSDPEGDERGEGEQVNDALVSLVLNRLLGVLKQLVAAAMKRGDVLVVNNYKAMYAVALRASQSGSGTVSEQIERAQNCLRTVTSTRGD